MATLKVRPTGADVLRYAGLPDDDPELQALAATHVTYWATLAGQHVRDPEVAEASFFDPVIAQVVTSAAARSMSNPTNLRRMEAGTWNAAPATEGWSLVERTALDRLRIRVG